MTESFSKGEIIEDIIIGIGLNINQMEFKGEIKENATSLKKEFGREFSKIDILARIFK